MPPGMSIGIGFGTSRGTISGSGPGGANDVLLLSGDMTDGDDKILLSGDMQAGIDGLILSGS